MLEIFDHLAVARDKSAHRTKRLGECSHDDVHLLVHTELMHAPAALRTKHSQRVRLVNVNARPKLLRHFELRRQVGNVAGHAEDPVHDDELSGLLRLSL